MSETPKFILEKVPGEVSEPTIVPIEAWAKENNREGLLRHMESSDKTDKNVGVFRENIEYDTKAKTITLTVEPNPDMHQGHSFEGTGIMLGGIPKVFIDVTSGALAFTEAPNGTIPLHMTGSYENTGMIIQHEAPVTVVSSFEKDPHENGDKKMLFIRTEVWQGGRVCVVMRDQIQVISERGAGALAKRLERSLDKESDLKKQEQ